MLIIVCPFALWYFNREFETEAAILVLNVLMLTSGILECM
jgi:hypothetical protein